MNFRSWGFDNWVTRSFHIISACFHDRLLQVVGTQTKPNIHVSKWIPALEMYFFAGLRLTCDWLLLQIVDLFYYSIHLDLQMKGVVRYFMVYNHWKYIEFINTHTFIYIYIYIYIYMWFQFLPDQSDPLVISNLSSFFWRGIWAATQRLLIQEYLSKVGRLIGIGVHVGLSCTHHFRRGWLRFIEGYLFFGTLSENEHLRRNTGVGSDEFPLKGRAWTHQV